MGKKKKKSLTFSVKPDSQPFRTDPLDFLNISLTACISWKEKNSMNNRIGL